MSRDIYPWKNLTAKSLISKDRAQGASRGPLIQLALKLQF